MSEMIQFIILALCRFGGADSSVNDLGGAIETFASEGATIEIEQIDDGLRPEWLQETGQTPQCVALAYDVPEGGSAGLRLRLVSDRGHFINAVDYSHAVFLTRASASTEVFEVRVADASREAAGTPVSLGSVVEHAGGEMPVEWAQIRMPLLEHAEDLDLSHLATVEFVFTGPASGRVHLDEILLVGMPAAALDPLMGVDLPDALPPAPDASQPVN
ncbi:MAG: hypothetical protein HUU25_08650 [Candidatus Sumerlaeia bacterium]|nr:hypothetical protein [Candidatus Sumerlaeia bacterium]